MAEQNKTRHFKFPTANRPRPAFTLVELLVVIAIIALLMSILSPALMRVKGLARRLKCTSNLKQVHLAFYLYLDDYDDTYPCAEDPVSTTPFYWLWMGRGWRSFVATGLNSSSIDVNSPSVLLCPADRTNADKYELTSYAYSMSFYHSSADIDTLNTIADTYSNPLPSTRQKSSSVAKPSRKILIGEWFSNHEPIEDEQGWWSWDGTRNYLFADGHVQLLKANQIKPARNGMPDVNLTFKGIKGADLPP